MSNTTLRDGTAASHRRGTITPVVKARTGGRRAATRGENGPVPLAAVERAIEVLDALGAAPEGIDLQTLATRVGMSPPGAYRTLQTLIRGGLAIQEGRRGLYRLGPKVLVLARSMGSEAALIAAADAELRALAEEARESVALAVVRGDRIWGIAAAAGTGDIVAQPRLAHGEPYFHTTGRGKLHLAHLPPAEARALLAATGMPKVGPNTITDEATLWAELEKVRAQGYAVNRGERSAHLAGVALPVYGADGTLIATVGITLPVYSLTEERERELARLGMAAARRIERRLNGERPGYE